MYIRFSFREIFTVETKHCCYGRLISEHSTTEDAIARNAHQMAT